MATSRELKNKISAVKNTKKITGTMEMISTAKSVVCQKRIGEVQPYGDKIAALLHDLESASTGDEEIALRYPLLRTPSRREREAVFVITANRGLCGGYNSNCLRLAERHIAQLEAAGCEPEIHVIGKKGAARFRYLGRAMAGTYTQFDDKPAFEEVERIFVPILERFASGELDGVSIVATRYHDAARQSPEVRAVLPLAATAGEGDGGGGDAAADFIFEPSPDVILGSLVPLSLKMQLFQALLEASTSEQIARRIAMKNATDNAEEMIRTYTQKYNRTRQAGITQEILEVVGGAEALQ